MLHLGINTLNEPVGQLCDPGMISLGHEISEQQNRKMKDKQDEAQYPCTKIMALPVTRSGQALLTYVCHPLSSKAGVQFHIIARYNSDTYRHLLLSYPRCLAHTHSKRSR
jgi:hypothetical protein